MAAAPVTELVACSVCGKPTNVTTATLAQQGCVSVTHAVCQPTKPKRAHADGRLHVEIVGDEERCYSADEQRYTSAIQDEWEQGRAGRDRERRRLRALHSLGERLDGAQHALDTTSAVSASQVGAQAKTTGDDEREPGPPKCEGPDIAANLKIIEYHVAKIERTLDEELGLVRPGAGGRMTSEEKDKIIWTEFEGVRAEDVAAADPTLGTSARTIMRARERVAARRKLKVRLVDGVVTGKVIEGA